MKDLKIIWIGLLGLMIWSAGHAQNFFVLGGTLHTGNGDVIEHAALVIEDGRIAAIHDARTIKIDPGFGPVITAYDQHIYPGLIAGFTTLGLNEIDYLRHTRDYAELGEFTPNIRSLIAYNTDSRVIPTVRSNGILYTQIVPEGGLISGSSSVMKMEAWNWEDAVVKEGDGIHLWWPAKFIRGGWWANPGAIQEVDSYDSTVDRIEVFMKRAKNYLAGNSNETNLVLAAMEGVFTGEQNLYVHVHGAGEIVAAVNMVEELGIDKMVIVGGSESEKVLGLLKEKDIPVMLTSIHKLSPRNHNDIHHWYKLPGILHDAGIQFCLTYADVPAVGYGSWENRSLPFLAGTAAAFGLDKETALASITKNAAEILGIDYSGTVVEGEEATFIISEGDVLDMRTSIITHAWIKGIPVDLNDKQKELYSKFRGKYVGEGKLVE